MVVNMVYIIIIILIKIHFNKQSQLVIKKYPYVYYPYIYF